MLTKPMPSLAYLNECLLLDHETGVLVWKVRPIEHFNGWRPHRAWNAAWAGKRAGRQLTLGYRAVFIKAKGGAFKEHRLVWAIANQAVPTQLEIIDHANGIKNDNRPSNLRICTPTNNATNKQVVNNTNTSGFRGVCKSSEGKRWIAYVSINGKQKNIGSFKTSEAAAQASQKARDVHYGEFKGITH